MPRSSLPTPELRLPASAIHIAEGRYAETLRKLLSAQYAWDIAESERGKITAVVCDPEKLRQKSFYLCATMLFRPLAT